MFRFFFVKNKVSMFGDGNLVRQSYGHRLLPLAAEHFSVRLRIQRSF